jgi:hypothetical protein
MPDGDAQLCGFGSLICIPGMFCERLTACQNSPAVAKRSWGFTASAFTNTASSASLPAMPNEPGVGRRDGSAVAMPSWMKSSPSSGGRPMSSSVMTRASA